MKDTNEFEKNKDKSKNVNPHSNTVSIIEIMVTMKIQIMRLTKRIYLM